MSHGVITIDGPAASGKSSVSRALAAKLGWNWLSTGIIYRGVAFMAKKAGLSPSDEGAILDLLDQEVWSLEMTPASTEFFFRGKSITSQLISEDIGSLASQVAQLTKLRDRLLQTQRDCETRSAMEGKGLIAEGRDCGSVVFPWAQLKVFLTARESERAQRRLNLEKGANLGQQADRDRRDSARVEALLDSALGAVTVDTSSLSASEVVSVIEGLWNKKPV